MAQVFANGLCRLVLRHCAELARTVAAARVAVPHIVSVAVPGREITRLWLLANQCVQRAVGSVSHGLARWRISKRHWRYIRTHYRLVNGRILLCERRLVPLFVECDCHSTSAGHLAASVCVLSRLFDDTADGHMSDYLCLGVCGKQCPRAHDQLDRPSLRNSVPSISLRR